MKTYQKLAMELRQLGLDDMAVKADTGYYHDYLSPLALPEIQLATELLESAVAIRPTDAIRADAIMRMRDRHINGEFDASAEEADEWANSPEGRNAFAELIAGRDKQKDN